MGYRVGRESKTYIDVMGAGQGTYEEITIVKSPTLGMEWDEAEVADHATFYKRYKKGMLDAPLELEINRKVGDTNYKALRDAALDPDAVIGIAICSGDMTVGGGELFEADWVVTQFPFNAPLTETETLTVQLKLAADSDFEPTLSDVAAV